MNSDSAGQRLQTELDRLNELRRELAEREAAQARLNAELTELEARAERLTKDTVEAPAGIREQQISRQHGDGSRTRRAYLLMGVGFSECGLALVSATTMIFRIWGIIVGLLAVGAGVLDLLGR